MVWEGLVRKQKVLITNGKMEKAACSVFMGKLLEYVVDSYVLLVLIIFVVPA